MQIRHKQGLLALFGVIGIGTLIIIKRYPGLVPRHEVLTTPLVITCVIDVAIVYFCVSRFRRENTARQVASAILGLAMALMFAESIIPSLSVVALCAFGLSAVIYFVNLGSPNPGDTTNAHDESPT